MYVFVSTILAILEIMLGYCEKKSNANLLDFENNAGSGNFTRFAKELDDIGYWNNGTSKKNGHEWCAPFVNWVIWIASGKNVAKTKQVLCIPENEENLAAGCEFLRNYFRRAGRYDAKPKIGDLVLFTTTNDGKNSADHVGFLTDISLDGTKIYTIEGNKDNKVSACAYPLNYWKVLGFCHPKYDEVESIDAVKELQERCAELTKKCDQLAIDYEEKVIEVANQDNQIAALKDQLLSIAEALLSLSDKAKLSTLE